MPEMEEVTILQKLMDIQSELKVEKTRYNEFGNFYARSKEDILEAVKPLAHSRGCVVLCNDEPQLMPNGWMYIKTTAQLIDVFTGEIASAPGFAREPDSKPKMDSSQTTGSASSYAGKRALGNLFALDDTKDSDEYDGQQQPPGNQPIIGACMACGTRYQFESAEQMTQCICQCGNKTFEAV